MNYNTLNKTHSWVHNDISMKHFQFDEEHYLKVTHNKIFINYRVNSGEAWESPPDQVIKVNLTNNGKNQNRAPLDRMQWEEHRINSVIFLPKM